MNYGPRTPDYEYTNESDGTHFNGYEDDNGRVAWYDDDGNLDCITNSPD